ncbi:hypothetical protein [Sphingomonas sp. GB1N7]|uniref:hypothetical protein n=1 Tax=Parasphingomonas caseinilytica TaxID=3096158 RepID=UPI002FC7BECE
MLAPLIAIVGCDGSGKSTLATDMAGVLGRDRPVRLAYLGLGSGAIGARIKRWPLIGVAAEAALAKRGTKARTKGENIPGLATALVIYGFSLLRRRRFRKVLALRQRGVTVITDRYPQIEVPGFYDGPGLSAARAGSSAVAWLAARELAMYEWMASHRPTLVLRLNIDAETAHARKPDHEIGLLRQKVAVTPSLKFGGAQIVDLDSRAPYDEMRRRALAGILPVLG